MKSEWEIGHIESSYSGRQRTFPPAEWEASTNTRNVRFSIHFSTQKKGLFHACVKKINFNLQLLDFTSESLESSIKVAFDTVE